MKKKIILLLCLLLCTGGTGCGSNVPAPDADVPTIPESVPEETQTEAEPTKAATTARLKPSDSVMTGTETDAASGTESGADPESEASGEDAQDDPEEEAAEAEVFAWETAYEYVLKQRYRRSEHEDSYFALIQLNADDIPELVILDGVEMALYTCEGKKAVLLLEDAYKSSAVGGQNVCYQPQKGLFSTAFSTMGGGSGFTIFAYAEMDTVHVERYYFDNSENEGGELPYNAIWDRAEEFEITDNGYHDVTLGKSWVHIGEDFDGIRKLTESNAEQLGRNWNPVSGEDSEDE